MSGELLMVKARASLGASEMLLDGGCIESAVNRAYFAMFHAARAALAMTDDVPGSIAKRHTTVISAFGLKIVREGRIGIHLGSWLNGAQELRNRADYGDRPFADAVRAKKLLEQATEFLAAVDGLLNEGQNP